MGTRETIGRPRRRRTASVLGGLLLALGIVTTATPVLASDPPSSDVTVPTTVGETLTVEWTGQIPPGVGEGVDCEASTTTDSHEVNFTVPAGAYDTVGVEATFTIDYTGNTDQKFTLVRPDGSTQQVDGGFLDESEATTVGNPEAGTWQVIACPYAGPTAQDYTGRLELVTKEATGGEVGGDGPVTCPAPVQAPKFEQTYIDTTRAGGEPLIVTHPDGTLLWGSHAGTTHAYGPAAPDPDTAAFLQNYEGQTYQYFSADNGATWQFSPRDPINADPLSGLPNSGFSDPEFAVDTAGNVFISEINLANIAFSKSTDVGRTWTLQNVVGISFSDRQWMDADEEDVLWFVANTFGGGSPTAGEPVTGSLDNRLYKSTDGGQTFSAGQSMGGQQSSDIWVDKSDGRLYQLQHGGGQLWMRVFPNARNETPPDVTFEDHTIATGVDYINNIHSFTIDPDGNLFVVWDETGNGTRQQGIYLSASTDRGVTWTEPQQLNSGNDLAIWPWVAAGENGGVIAVWWQHDGPVEGADPELATGDWHVYAAVSQTGLGCGASDQPGFVTTRATTEAFHTGTICNGGTVCQAEAVDRRLGDYFSVTVDGNGNAVVATSDTRQGGSVSLPLMLRQTAGPSLRPSGEDVEPAPEPEPEPDSGPLPTTGGGAVPLSTGLIAAGLVLLALGARRHRPRLW